jgi:hypothetical protein
MAMINGQRSILNGQLMLVVVPACGRQAKAGTHEPLSLFHDSRLHACALKRYGAQARE